MPSTFKIAFIGTGGRSVPYATHLLQCEDIDIVALADPLPDNRQAMRQRAGIATGPAEFDDWRQLLRDLGGELDGVVICSPNHLHAEQAVPFLERGLPVALEKPIAITQGDCERIIDAERANGGRTLVGFVLRSAPFYLQIKELLDAGAIGRLVSIQADELVGWLVTSLMERNVWRRHRTTSGGSLLEKCCHDMDILNWMMASRPVAIHSFGNRLALPPNSLLPDTCPGCPHADDCNYYQEPVGAAHEDEGERVLHQFIGESHRCIYNIDKDALEAQALTIQYEHGAVATFMLNFNAAGPRAGRSFCAVGQKGMIWGNINELKVSLYDNRTGKTRTFDTSGDGSGHGGGDRKHVMQFVRMLREPAYRPPQDAYAGYLSAVTCFAADRSVAEGRAVNFRYTRGGGYVELT